MPDDTPARPNLADRFPKHIRRTPGDYGRGHLKVDNMLSPEDRDAYYALLRQPGTTLKVCIEWLKSHGYDVGKGAVMHHKQHFDGRLLSVRISAEMSLACSDLLRQVGVHRMSDAAVVRFETLLTQALFDLQEGKSLKREQWDVLGRALNNAVGNRVKVETLRLETEQAQQRAAGTRPNRRPFDGVAVVNALRRRMRMPASSQPAPGVPGQPAALPPPQPPPDSDKGPGDATGADTGAG
jgi:hypothetical protein